MIPFVNYDTFQTAKNVLVFTMLFDGIPMIYQGQEQHLSGNSVPVNREAIWLTKYDTNAELYKLIAKLNRIRNHAAYLGTDYFDDSTHTIFQGGSELAFTKGVQGRQVVMVLSTQPSTSSAYQIDMAVSFNAGTAVTNVLDCTNYTVDNQGMLHVPMNKGEPRVFYPTNYMDGIGLCGYPESNVSLTMLRTHSSTSAGIRTISGTGLATLLLAVVSGIFFHIFFLLWRAVLMARLGSRRYPFMCDIFWSSSFILAIFLAFSCSYVVGWPLYHYELSPYFLNILHVMHYGGESQSNLGGVSKFWKSSSVPWMKFSTETFG